MKTILEDTMIISGVSSLANAYTAGSVTNNTNNTDSVKENDGAVKLEDKEEEEVDYANEDVEDVDPYNYHNPKPQKILSAAGNEQIDILL